MGEFKAPGEGGSHVIKGASNARWTYLGNTPPRQDILAALKLHRKDGDVPIEFVDTTYSSGKALNDLVGCVWWYLPGDISINGNMMPAYSYPICDEMLGASHIVVDCLAWGSADGAIGCFDFSRCEISDSHRIVVTALNVQITDAVPIEQRPALAGSLQLRVVNDMEDYDAIHAILINTPLGRINSGSVNTVLN